METLFLNSKLSVAKISLESFDVFYELFLRTNYYKKNLEIRHTGLYSRTSFELIGLNELISILYSSTDEEVINKSMKLIISLNLKLSRQLLPKREEI